MSIIILPRPRSQKPPTGVQIQQNHPLAYGLVGAFLMNEGGGPSTRDAMNNNVGTSAAPPTWTPTNFGIGMKFVKASSQFLNCGVNTVLRNSVFTKIAWLTASTSADQGISSLGGSAPYWRVTGGIGTASFGLLKAGIANIGSATGQTIPATSVSCLAVSYDASGNYIFYLNGVNVSSGTNLQTFAFSDSYYIGADRTGEFFDGIIAMNLEYNRVLNQSEIISLYTNPFSFLQPQIPQVRYWSSTPRRFFLLTNVVRP